MNAFVVFGSKSDERVYAPCVEALGLEHKVVFEVLSAHRNPEGLREALQTKKYSFVVAGAGLASHLPGVVASQIKKPVFGIPVPAAFGGLDAFLSILQMPFGVPVMTLPPGREKDLLPLWIQEAQTLTRKHFEKIHVVIDPKVFLNEEVQREWQRLNEYARKRDVTLKKQERPLKGEVNIVLVTTPSMVIQNPQTALALHSYVMEKKFLLAPNKALEVFDCACKRGGLWVGVNNTRNALCALLQWRDLL